MFDNALDAVRLEYQPQEGGAFGYLSVSDVVNSEKDRLSQM